MIQDLMNAVRNHSFPFLIVGEWITGRYGLIIHSLRKKGERFINLPRPFGLHVLVM